MKKIIFCLAACTVIAFVFYACGPSGCNTKRPKYNLIDWNNYNDVYTTYWNFYGSEDVWNAALEKRPTSVTPLMICGYISDYSLEQNYLVLIDDSLSAVQNKWKRERIVARFSDNVSEIIRNSNIHNKCFISAYQLVMVPALTNCASYTQIELIINSHYIYFNN